MDEKEYILHQNESCKGFLQRALGGQVSADTIKMTDILLEMIIPEISAGYSLTLCHQVGEIDIVISHGGKAVKADILDIVKDQVDRLRYRHSNKDRHILKISKIISEEINE